ncbi:MAG: hypothetical protein WAW52_00055 [Methanothrix sp.]
MLDFQRRGTYTDQNTKHTWEYYGDDEKGYLFYVLPAPALSRNDQGDPLFKLVSYKTDDNRDGSGYVQITVELDVPENIKNYIKNDIKTHPDKSIQTDNPIIDTLKFNPGSKAVLVLTGKNAGGSSDQIDVEANASSFGNNQVTFLADLNKDMVQSLKDVFMMKGGTYQVKYQMTVPARLKAVTANLSFDSAIAYNYQVTVSVQSHTWSSDTITRSAEKYMNESGCSKTEIDWGISNPSKELVKSVSNWANGTLKNLISEEINKQIALLGQESIDSFKISDVSSFKATYTENQVVDWILEPTAILPSLADLGKDITDFTETVTSLEQIMKISTELPFAKDSTKSLFADSQAELLLIDTLVVTVKYPSLHPTKASCTFLQNGSHTFRADYDKTASSKYEVEYTVTLKDKDGGSRPTITGKKIVNGVRECHLVMADMGILFVAFDAHNVFSVDKNVMPDEIEIFISYNTGEEQQFFADRLLIKSKDRPHIKYFVSMAPLPINGPYNYYVKYSYKKGTEIFYGDNQTGSERLQNIDPVSKMKPINVVLDDKDDDNNKILGADAYIWYDIPPTVSTAPDASKVHPLAVQPTREAPAVIHLENVIQLLNGPYEPGAGSHQFFGFANPDSPIYYSAVLRTSRRDVTIDDQKISPTLPGITISVSQRYFTLEVDPSIIAWENNDIVQFDKVKVSISFKISEISEDSSTSGKPRTIKERDLVFEKDGKSQYLTRSYEDGEEITYDWKVTYLKSKTYPSYAQGTGESEDIFTIPPFPKANN